MSQWHHDNECYTGPVALDRNRKKNKCRRWIVMGKEEECQNDDFFFKLYLLSNSCQKTSVKT